jgi:hypothetical protein
MTVDQAEQVRARLCGGKDRYCYPGDARRAAFRLGLKAYRCSFARLDGGAAHWHIGHNLTVQGMTFLAAAIRVLAQRVPVGVPEVPAA